MQRTPFRFSLCLILFILGCQPNEPIETYRVSKETGPAALLPANAKPRAPRDVEWTTPAGWKELPPSSMRLGSFLVLGSNGKTADVSVIPLSGPAGGHLANINRWRGQIQLPPISEADLQQTLKPLTIAGRKMFWVDFAHDQRRLVAAIYQQGDRTWFFKMTGEDNTVGEAKPAFRGFLQSLRFHGRS